MRDIQGSYILCANEVDVKKKKTKNFSKDDNCNCYSPDLKIHHYHCPLGKKLCPIHGENSKHKITSDVASLYPKTMKDGLFNPFQSVTTPKCCSANTSDYSKNRLLKYESLKHKEVQTSSKDLNIDARNSLIKSTKKTISIKSDKIKKYRKCFYSPCDSLARVSINKKFSNDSEEKVSIKSKDTLSSSNDNLNTSNDMLDFKRRKTKDINYNHDFECFYFNQDKSYLQNKVGIFKTKKEEKELFDKDLLCNHLHLQSDLKNSDSTTRKISSEINPNTINSHEQQDYVEELSRDVGTNTSIRSLLSPRSPNDKFDSFNEPNDADSTKTENKQKRSKSSVKDVSTQFNGHRLSILPVISSEHSKSEGKPSLRKINVENTKKQTGESINLGKIYKNTTGVQTDPPVDFKTFESDKKYKNTTGVQTDSPGDLKSSESDTSTEEETTNFKYQKRSPQVNLTVEKENSQKTKEIGTEITPKTSIKTIQTSLSFTATLPPGCYCKQLTQTENNETLTLFPPSEKNCKELLINNDVNTNSEIPLCTELEKSFSESQVSDLRMFGQVKEGKKILQVDFERHQKTNHIISSNTSKANESNFFDLNDSKLTETPLQITSFSAEKTNPSPVSDLSDLIKIIDRCFDKMSEFKEIGRCQCFLNSNNEFHDKSNLEKNSQQINIRQSVPLNKHSGTSDVLICKICLNKIKIFTEDKSTITENEISSINNKKIQNYTDSKPSTSGEQKKVRDSSIPVPRKSQVPEANTSSVPKLSTGLTTSPSLTREKNTTVAFNEGSKKNPDQRVERKPNVKSSSRSQSQINSNASRNNTTDSNNKQMPSTSKSSVDQQRKPPKSSKSRSNSFTYSVIVSPMWPKQILHNLQEKAVKHLCKKKSGKKFKAFLNDSNMNRRYQKANFPDQKSNINDEEFNENSCFILRPTKSESWSNNYIEENIDYDECFTSNMSKNRRIKSANFFWIPAFSTKDSLKCNNSIYQSEKVIRSDGSLRKAKHKEKYMHREKNHGFTETCYGDHLDSDSVQSSTLFEEDKLYSKSCASIIQEILTYFHEKWNLRPLENINEKDHEVSVEHSDFSQSNEDSSENES